MTADVFGDYVTTLPPPGGVGGSNVAGLTRVQDVDRDGDVDLVFSYLVGPGEMSTETFLHLNDGDGSFAPFHMTKDGVPLDEDEIAAAFPADLVARGVPLVFDANGDGVEDIVLVGIDADLPGPGAEIRVVVFAILAGEVRVP